MAEPLQGLPQANETLARYLYDKKHFSKEKAYAKHRAFMPDHLNETSVFRTLNLSEEHIWKMGRLFGRRDPVSGRPLNILARADLYVFAVLARGLTVECDEPPVRHACIRNWSTFSKDAWISVAQELAADSRLHIRPIGAF